MIVKSAPVSIAALQRIMIATRNWQAIERNCIRAGNGAIAVDRTALAMTDEYDGFHLCFFLSKLSAGASNTSAGGGAALTLNKRQIIYQLIATERL